jgi:small subunit ribosomal protein S21e
MILFSSASNRIINARDHASIQLNFCDVDPVRGVMTGKYTTYAICGSIRQMGESDDSMNYLAKRDSLLPS